jgi:hypothetical protein
LSPETSELKRLQKIQQIKINKDKRNNMKRKMRGQDGPIEIKIEDYIRETRKNMEKERAEENNT